MAHLRWEQSPPLRADLCSRPAGSSTGVVYGPTREPPLTHLRAPHRREICDLVKCRSCWPPSRDTHRWLRAERCHLPQDCWGPAHSIPEQYCRCSRLRCTRRTRLSAPRRSRCRPHQPQHSIDPGCQHICRSHCTPHRHPPTHRNTHRQHRRKSRRHSSLLEHRGRQMRSMPGWRQRRPCHTKSVPRSGHRGTRWCTRSGLLNTCHVPSKQLTGKTRKESCCRCCWSTASCSGHNWTMAPRSRPDRRRSHSLTAFRHHRRQSIRTKVTESKQIPRKKSCCTPC